MNETAARLEKLLDGPRDGALLRYALGNEYLKLGEFDHAVSMFRSALERDAAYSAAWKALGRALVSAGRPAEAVDAYTRGIAVAEGRGDIQAAKEMKVFLKRLQKTDADRSL